jgi:hypothetical protein
LADAGRRRSGKQRPDVDGNNALTSATAAAVAFVERQRPDLATGQAGDAAYDITADVKHGTAMLAARLYERRGSMLGIAPSAGYDEAATILRNDPDIERLLQIGRSRPFGFGAAV